MRFVATLLSLLPYLVSALEAPVVGITATMVNGNGQILGDSVYVSLSWSPVPSASRYQVFYRPLLTDTPGSRGFTTSTSFEVAIPTGWGWQGDPDMLGFFTVGADSQDGFITIPAGSFPMGQVGVATPVHVVTLTHSFLIGRTEVTNAQYLEALNWAMAQGLVSVVGDFVQQYGVNLLRINQSDDDPCEISYDAETQLFYLYAGTWSSGYYGPGFAYPFGYDPADHPVKFVSWFGAACYCDWRSQMDWLPSYYNGNWTQIPSPNNPYNASGYRLPTESEWEFAARYDDGRTYPWGEVAATCEMANFAYNYWCVGWTSPVGTHPAGASNLGLQDVAGNVYEWINDWYAEYENSPQSDPTGPATGNDRIARGGSWGSTPELLSCALRSSYSPISVNYYGFRICIIKP
jgi:formylglycine-generating enzyme required for sulfatase activity